MINHKLDEIVITETIQQAVNRYNIPGGWTRDEPCVSSFKDEIKGKLIANQNGKCAYCGLPLSSRNPEIDHIAPKGGPKRPYHTECTFLPINLVYACHHCNSSGCKGQKIRLNQKMGRQIIGGGLLRLFIHIWMIQLNILNLMRMRMFFHYPKEMLML